MTRSQRVFARRWRWFAVATVLLALIAAVAIGYRWLSSESNRADGLAAEADLRGGAVSTLATDVRELRAQLKAKGVKPKAPDPAKAVRDLPDRAAVPVPIPGPKGDKGDPGKDGQGGKDGQSGKPGDRGNDGTPGTPGNEGSPGANGQDGQAGEKGEPGEQGPQGEQGPRGEQGPPGEPGPAGSDCPDGYSWQAPNYDPDALVCRRDGAPQPSPPSDGGPLNPLALAMFPAYRRL